MKVLALIALAVAAGGALAQSHYRQGYVTKQGAYVPPSYATNPNATVLDNYSTKGNVNPYTGKAGTVNPYKAQPLPTYEAPVLRQPQLAPMYIPIQKGAF